MMKKCFLKTTLLAAVLCAVGGGYGSASLYGISIEKDGVHAHTSIMKDYDNTANDGNSFLTTSGVNIVTGSINKIGEKTSAGETFATHDNSVYGYKNKVVPHNQGGYSQVFGSQNNVGSSTTTVIGHNNNVAYDTKTYTTMTTSTGGYTYNTVLGDSNTVNGGSYGVAVGYNNSVSADYGVAIGATASANGKMSVAIGYGAKTTADSDDVKVADETWMTTVSFGDNNTSTGGKSYFARLKNVYEGKDDYDAVNVKQLKNYVANNAGKYDGSDTVTVTAPTTTGAASTIAVKNMAMGADVTDAGVTTGATATGSAAIALGQTANAGGDKSLALGYGASVTVGNAVALGAGSVADTENTVSVGSSSQQRKIVNVAEGTKNTDAATYGQIAKAGQTITNTQNELKDNNGNVIATFKIESASFTAGDNVEISDDDVISVKADGKVEAGNKGIVTGGEVYDHLSGMKSDLEGQINKVGAGAAALAMLHSEGFDPANKWNFAVGYGHYKNANAGALGAFYKPNADTTVTVASTMGNGNPMFGAGVSFKIGRRGQSLSATASNAELVQEVNHLRAQNSRYEEKIDAQEKRIENLEAMVQKLVGSAGKV